jgi:glycosyltransferase involved in cell wall biosynthesis
MAMTKIPSDKILVTRNGVQSSRFDGLTFDKEHGRIAFASSPDRGLDKALRVMDYVVKDIPEAKLHIYYGFDNMLKFKMTKDVEYYQKLIDERKGYAVLHGNIQQNLLMSELSKTQVWLYPTHFMETFCISAIEMLGCKVYPVTRSFGALKNTLQSAKEKGYADLLDLPCETEAQYQEYANRVVAAIREESWKKVNEDMKSHDWAQVAKEWLPWLIST